MNPKAKKYANYCIDISMAVAFILVCITGIIKYPPFQTLIGLDITRINHHGITQIHDLSGIAVVILGLAHILLHLKWIKNVTKQILSSKRPQTRIVFLLGIGTLAFILLLCFILMFTPPDLPPIVEPSPTHTTPPTGSPEPTTEPSPEPTATKRPKQGRHDQSGTLPEGLDLSQYALVDGVYIGESTGYREGMQVEVTIKGGEVTAIEVISHNESRGYYERPFEALPPAVLNDQSTAVDTITGATMTSNGFLLAVEDAINKAIE